VVRETVCEMANMVIGIFRDAAERPRLFISNVSAGNSYGRNGTGRKRGHGSAGDFIETPCGNLYLNIAMHYCPAAAGAQRGSGAGLKIQSTIPTERDL